MAQGSPGAASAPNSACSQRTTLHERLHCCFQQWRDALRHPSKMRCAVLAFVLLFVVQIGIVEQYFSEESAAVARGTAVMGSSVYQSAGRSEIAVLEVNNAYLDLMAETWPPSYVLYETLLEDVAAYQPKSIFLDIALVHSRIDVGLDPLIERLCRIHQSGIPVYLAALENAQGQLYLRQGLDARPDGECFIKVGVRYDPDPNTHLATTYPLYGNGAAPELDVDPEQKQAARQARQHILSAAYRMASDDCKAQAAASNGSKRQCDQQAPSALPQTMSLTWAMHRYPEENRPAWMACNFAPRHAIELLPGPVRRALFGTAAPCPAHAHVSLVEIAAPKDDTVRERLHSALEGKHVMVGAVVQGVNDMVNSPIHGYIPGVYLHAMALDNLRTQWPDIKPAQASRSQTAWAVLIAAVLAVVCFFLHGVLQAVFGMDEDAPGAAPPSSARWQERLSHEVGYFARWAGAKAGEIVITLLLTWAVFMGLLNYTSHSLQTLAQMLTVVFALQWTGITRKVFKSLFYVFFQDPHTP